MALGSQLQDQRQRTHAAVANALVAAEPERADANAALLAHHYEEAGEVLEAARQHARAAQWMGTRDLDETLRHWQCVRELVRVLEKTSESEGLRLLACVQILTTGGFRLGFSEAAVDELYDEGRVLAEKVGNKLLLTALRGAYGARLSTLGRVREALDLNMETCKIADESGEKVARAGSRVGAAYARTLCGYLAEAVESTREGEEIAGDDLQLGREMFGFSYQVWFVMMRGWMLAALGHRDESQRDCVRGVRLARASGIPENLGWAQSNLAILAEMTGSLSFEELGDARAAALDALRIAEEMGSPFSRAAAMSSVGAAHTVAGDCEQALPFLQEALELIRSRRTGLEFEALTLTRLANARLGAGDAPAARIDAEEAVAATAALAAEVGARIVEPRIVHARALLEQACGDAVSAERFLHEAHRLYGEVGAEGDARRVGEALGLGA